MINTVWPDFARIVAPLGLTLPPEIVTLIVTSAFGGLGVLGGAEAGVDWVTDGEVALGVEAGVLATEVGGDESEELLPSPLHPVRASIPSADKARGAAYRMPRGRIVAQPFVGEVLHDATADLGSKFRGGN